jgi:hypothetical protein
MTANLNLKTTVGSQKPQEKERIFLCVRIDGSSLQMWMMVVTQAVDVLLVKVSAATSGNGQR